VFTIPILAFTMSDPGVHVALILAFTFDRSGRSGWTGVRTEGEWRATFMGDDPLLAPAGFGVAPTPWTATQRAAWPVQTPA
jgi:hypothetical protein